MFDMTIMMSKEGNPRHHRGVDGDEESNGSFSLSFTFSDILTEGIVNGVSFRGVPSKLKDKITGTDSSHHH